MAFLKNILKYIRAHVDYNGQNKYILRSQFHPSSRAIAHDSTHQNTKLQQPTGKAPNWFDAPVLLFRTSDFEGSETMKPP